MKRSSFIYAVLFFSFHSLLLGQLPSTYQMEDRICDFDPTSTQVITQLRDFNIFQTLDGGINSPIDSTQCFVVEQEGPDEYVSLENIDITKPIFVKLRLQDSLQYPILANQLHYLISRMPFSNHDLLDGNDCSNDDCTLLSLKVKYSKDEDGNDQSKVREYYYPECEGIESCFVSQNIEEQYLVDVMIKIVIDDDPGTQNKLYLPSFGVWEDWWGASIENEISVSELYRVDDDTYSAQLGELFQNEIVILQHNNGACPSSDNIDYIEVILEEKQDVQQTINLFSEDYMSVFLQDYVELRGELVEGDDSIRHNVNFIFDNNGMCVQIVELVSGNNVDLFFRNDSEIELKSREACIRIEYGSSIHIQQDELQVGKNSIGMLALYDDATINVEENSSLLIGGNFTFNQRKNKGQPKCYVEKGGELKFIEGAFLNSYVDGLQLHVYLIDDAKIDMSYLSVSDRSKIKVIRRSSSFEIGELKVFPNPVSNVLNIPISYTGEVNVSVFNYLGSRILVKSITELINEEYIQLDVNDFSSGVYFIIVEAQEKEYSAKFVKY